MIYNETIAIEMAKILLEVKAVILKPDEPFTWASGWKSPIYCDNRVLLSFPEKRNFVKKQLAEMVNQMYPEAKALVGVATAGIAHAALAADQLFLPMAYARSKAKDHGTKSILEGRVEAGTPVVVIEDLISTGKSSLEIVLGLKEIGLSIQGVAGIFSYDFNKANEAFKAEHISYYTLTDYNILLSTALEINYVTKNQIDILKEWRVSPDTWGK